MLETNFVQRYSKKISITAGDQCWKWIGSISVRGYGVIRLNKRVWLAHRLAWEMQNGPLADSLVLDHLCRNKGCVRLSHLEAVTQKVNVARGNRSIKPMFCHRGHSLHDENIYVSQGKRSCKICVLANSK